MKRGAWVLLCCGVIFPTAGNAQQLQPTGGGDAKSPDSGLEEIIVTAQKRGENLQKVPIAVTALTAQSLAAKGIANTTDLVAVTPGLNYTTGGGYALPRIRGVGAGSTSGGNENPVATYVDGVYIASATSSVMSLSNIAQIAVLKGPQGTLFGRNATGGLIQITTRDPSFNFGGDGSFTYGNKDRIGGDLYLTGGLTGFAAADLAVHYMNQQDGYGTNLFNGKDVNKSREFVIRSKIKLDLGPDTTATLAGDYSRVVSAIPAFRPITGTTPITGIPFSGGKFDVNSNVQPISKLRQGGGSLTINHEFGFAKAVSITAYRAAHWISEFDNDKLPAALAGTHLEQPDKQFSQEIQLISRPGSSFDWALGGFYFFTRSSLDPFDLQTPTVGLITETSQSSRSGAAFGQATFHLTDQTNLTVGLRYTSEKRGFAGQPSTRLVNGTVISGQEISDSAVNNKLTWRLALDHRFSNSVMGYVSYNRGFKSGGFNPSQTTPPLVPFSPEVLDAYETGLKADMIDGMLRLNTAAFYYDYKNLQVTVFTNGLITVSNAASAKIYGLDLDGIFAPTSDFRINFGLSLIHDRFGDYPGVQLSTPRPTGGNLITTLPSNNARGNRIPSTPDWTANLGADYDIHLSNGRIQLSGNYFHSDGWFAEADNRVRQRAYDLFNGSVTWFIGDKDQYQVKLWGRNLTNVAYATQMNAQANSDGVAMAAGRAFGATIGAKF